MSVKSDLSLFFLMVGLASCVGIVIVGQDNLTSRQGVVLGSLLMVSGLGRIYIRKSISEEVRNNEREEDDKEIS